MKEIICGFMLGCIFITIFCGIVLEPVPQNQVTKSVPFFVEGKEWLCSYTPRQVEINAHLEAIEKLKQ